MPTETKPIKRCSRCSAAQLEERCVPCTTSLHRAEPPRKLTPMEIHHEIRTWLPCAKEAFPVEPTLWARRMSVILGRDVNVNEIGRIAELLGEAKAKHPLGGKRRRFST